MSTMQAAVLYGPSDLRIEEVARPVPGPGEIVMKVEAALTGGTAAKFIRRGYHARMGDAPYRLGHEGAGVVEAVGEGVENFSVGDRVVPANSASCGVCELCKRGMTAQCADMVWLRGTYASSVLVPARIVTMNLHRVPDGMDAVTAALAENLACVLKARDRMPVRAGENVVVLGVGALGLLWTRVLSLTGVSVTAVDPNPERRELARTLGAEAVEDSGAFEERVAAGAVGADLVVEAVGAAQAWEIAIAAVAPGGRVLLFGGPPKGTAIPLDTQRMHYDELTILASFHHTPYHFAEALRALAAGLLDDRLLIREEIGLDDLPGFFRRYGPDGPPKAVVR